MSNKKNEKELKTVIYEIPRKPKLNYDKLPEDYDYNKMQKSNHIPENGVKKETYIHMTETEESTEKQIKSTLISKSIIQHNLESLEDDGRTLKKIKTTQEYVDLTASAGQRIRDKVAMNKLENKNMTQQEIAEATCTSQSSVSREKNKNKK